MADFRKWIFAFSVVAFLLVASVPAHAQFFNPNAFTCVANAGVPPIVRAEGITELVGDLVLNCTGGSPTPAGQAIPLTNVTVFLNTNITSRIVGPGNGSEALLLIDEPYPAVGSQVPLTAPNPPSNQTPALQAFCQVSTSTGFLTGTGCVANGQLGNGGGVGNTGPYRSGFPNIYQGQQVGASSVAWLGVPIDAPGTNLVRTIRITNVRANACQLGTSSTLVPTQIVMYVAINGSQQVTINNPQQTIAFIQPGLVVGGTSTTFLQCLNANGNLVTSGASVGQTNNFTLRAQEGFASSFKARGYLATTVAVGTPPTNVTVIGQLASTLQNVPGFPYNTESGFVSAATNGSGNGGIGVADFGTRIGFTFTNIGAGVSLFAPTTIPLVLAGTSIPSGGTATLVSGSMTVVGGATAAVYEIVNANPNAVESLNVPISVAFVSNTTNNLPGLGVSTGTVAFSPQSTVNTATTSDPIPRFCPGPTRTLFTINACTCNLLFPFVTNQAGFDTGMAIANTSLDPFGTPTQAGTVTLNYYGGTTGGGAAPAAATSQTIPAGAELVGTLSNGMNFGIAATPGFQGYIIATTKFQYCHGFAFISDLGAQKLAEGYLAIQLDSPGLPRTGQVGENDGH
ncbi:MAG: hypothetical protein ACR2NN_00075 [Bryobacteraceae bacterium]